MEELFLRGLPRRRTGFDVSGSRAGEGGGGGAAGEEMDGLSLEAGDLWAKGGRLNSLSSVRKSSVGVSRRSGDKSGMVVLTLPMAVNGLTLCLLTRMERPFLIKSRVPLGKTLETTYGPSHLSSSFSLVLRNKRRSRKTN